MKLRTNINSDAQTLSMNNIIQENIATYIGREMFLFLTLWTRTSVLCELCSKMSSGCLCWMDGACLLSTYRTHFDSKQNLQTCCLVQAQPTWQHCILYAQITISFPTKVWFRFGKTSTQFQMKLQSKVMFPGAHGNVAAMTVELWVTVSWLSECLSFSLMPVEMHGVTIIPGLNEDLH